MADLTDSILRHALELQRLSQGEEAKAVAELEALERDLRTLLNDRNLSSASKREITAVIRQADEAIGTRYLNASKTTDIGAIAEHVADRTVQIMQAAYPAISIGAPGIERMRSLARDILIDGAPSSAWWAKQGEDTAFKFAGVVRRGVLNGATNEQIVRDVAGRGGIMDVSRRNARALVHSSVMTAANHARLETFRKNAKFSAGVEWLATLDSNTCITCAVLDGAQWDFDGKALNGTAAGFQSPPAHWNCRCLFTPVLKGGLDEIFGKKGLDAKNAKTTRASEFGSTDARTFADFLKRQDAAFVEEVLGKRRAELYLAGKLTLTDLITKGGREKTLAELVK